jgi:integrase
LQKNEPKVLEKPQLQWFLSGTEGDSWLHALLLLDAASGCRRGELLALTWPDVDMENSVLTVSRSLAQTRRKGVFLKLPKGRRTRRFSLSPSAIDALKLHRAQQAKNRVIFGDDYNQTSI